MNIQRKFASLGIVALLLAGCSGADISGTYAENDSALTIRFDSGKAYVTGLTSMETKEAAYKVDGDRITVDGTHGPHLVLTRNKDGTLHLNGIGGTLTKTKTDSGS